MDSYDDDEGDDLAPMFCDALSLVDAARADFAEGQMVRDERLGLMDLMSAIEVMDPRTDSFVVTARSAAAADDNRVAFDPTAELSPLDVVWIMDEILRLEATFLDGHPLGLTLFTCLYFRPEALRLLSNSATSGPRRVLRALLRGVIQTAEMMWEELAKAQVYDHEDVHLHLASLSFSSLHAACYPAVEQTPHAPPGEKLTVEQQVLQELEEAREWVSTNVKDVRTRDALIERIGLRDSMIWICALLDCPSVSEPGPITLKMESGLSNVAHLAKTASHEAPSPAAAAAFARGTTVPLPSPQPPREIEPLAFDDALNLFVQMGNDIEDLANVWACWQTRRDWADVREYFVSISRRSMIPFMRSTYQSFLMTPPDLFGLDTPLDLTAAFFFRLAVVPRSTWHDLVAVRDKETTWDAPARKALGWADKCANFLISSLNNRCQNRARGRRLVVKGLPMALQLADELDSLTTVFKTVAPSVNVDNLSTALRSYILSDVFEALMSGSELNLYEADEWSRVWWVAGHTAGRVSASLRGSMRGEHMLAQKLELMALSCMCYGAVMFTALDKSQPAARLAEPLLPLSLTHDRDAARFEQRFKWLRGTMGAHSDPLDDLAQWDEFQARQKKDRATETSKLIQEAKAQFDAVGRYLGMLSPLPLAPRGLSVGGDDRLRWLAALRRTALANVNKLDSLARLDAAQQAHALTNLKLRWESPWFPIWA